MAIEKILNTRIRLKYDLYSNWSTNNPKLLEGEVALAYIPTGENSGVTVGETSVNGTTPPQVLIKVGDGVHNYNDLEYVSAKAADVLAACKSENALKTFINNVIADAGIATSDAMEALADRVTALEGDEDTEGSVAKAIKDAIDALDLINTYAEKEHEHTAEDITDFATEVAKIKVDEATKATQDGNGKVIAETYAEKATTLAGYGIADAYTQEETDDAIEGAINTLLSAYITSDGGAIDKLQDIANWIDNDKDGVADIIADIEKNAEDIGKIDNHSHGNKELLDTYTQTNDDITDAVTKKHSHTFVDTDVEDAITKKHEHTNATVLDDITSEKVSAWDTAVQTISTTFTDENENTVYTGLKATKNGTDIALDFDDRVVFVFNCGGAEVE